jgi:hypothetical protein
MSDTLIDPFFLAKLTQVVTQAQHKTLVPLIDNLRLLHQNQSVMISTVA